MTAFLVVLVIILFGVAVWQMGKIFQMSQTSSTKLRNSSDKDNNVNGYLMLGFVFLSMLLAIVFWKWGDVLLPNLHQNTE